jgi:type 1 fimbria pilin
MCYLNRPAEQSGLTLSYASTASVPVFSGTLPPVNGQDMNGKVLQTNIPGVGAHIRLGLHYDGTSANAFAPDNPREGARVPFTATARTGMLTEFPASNHHNVVTLVKIGAIPAGPQNLDGSELFRGTYSDVGTATSFGLTGTVIQAQCTVTSNPVSADPVQLGEWQSSDFTGPGFTTATVPFNIQLSNCETDSSGATIATAHMKLEGKDGSVSVDPALGVFSLTSNSSAKGVGIQILKADGITPMPLDTEVPLVTLSPGDIRVHFNARFYQTAAAIQAGDAKGALGFTMTYK